MKFKRLASLLICFVMILSFAACGSSGGGEPSPDVPDRKDVKYGDMVFGEFDDTEFNDIVDALDEAIASEGNDSEVAELIDRLIDVYAQLCDAYTYLEIEYYSTPEDEEKFEKYIEADALSVYIDDDLRVIVSRILDSPYEQLMLDALKLKDASSFYGYEGMSDEEAALQDRITELEAEFNEYYSGTKEVTAEYNGQKWTWEDWDSLDVYSDEYEDVYAALYRAEAMEMGRILIEEARLRNEVAAMHGYANYYEMAWTENYSRTYSYDDFEIIAGYTRQYLKSYPGILQSIDYLRADYLPLMNVDVTGVYDELLNGKYLGANAAEAVKYIRDYDLLHIVGEEAYAVGFSTKFFTYSEPFIYVHEEDPVYTMSFLVTIAHETGHCINFYYDHNNSVASFVFDLDVAETQSTGFVLMYMDKLQKIYGDAGKGIPRQFFADAIGTLQNCGFQAEVERILYTTPDLTPEKVSEMAGDIARAFGYDAANEADGNNYFWAHIPHYSDSPGYVVSYVMSQAASLAMYARYLEEPRKAAELFDELLTENTSAITYTEMVEKYGLDDKIYSEAFYKKLVDIAEQYRKQ